MAKSKYQKKINKIKREKDAYFANVKSSIRDMINNIRDFDDNIYDQINKLDKKYKDSILNDIVLIYLEECSTNHNENLYINITIFKKIVSYLVSKNAGIDKYIFTLTHLPISDCFPFYGFDRNVPTDDQEYFDDINGEYFRDRNTETQNSFYDSINFSGKIGNRNITKPIYWLMKELLKINFVPEISWALITSIVTEDNITIIEEFLGIFTKKITNPQRLNMLKTGIFYAGFMMSKINTLRYCFDNRFMIPMDFMDDRKMCEKFYEYFWTKPVHYHDIPSLDLYLPHIYNLMKDKLNWEYIRNVGICEVPNGYTWSTYILMRQKNIADVNFLEKYMGITDAKTRALYMAANDLFRSGETDGLQQYGKHIVEIVINNIHIQVRNVMYVCYLFVKKYMRTINDDDIKHLCYMIRKREQDIETKYIRVQTMIILMAQMTNEIMYHKNIDYPITSDSDEVKIISKLLSIYKQVNDKMRRKKPSYVKIEQTIEDKIFTFYEDIIERIDILNNSLPLPICTHIINDMFYTHIRDILCGLISDFPDERYNGNLLLPDHLFDLLLQIKNNQIETVA